MLCFGIEHFIFRAAGTATFLPPDFFLLLPPFAFNAKNFFFELIAQIAPGEVAVRALQAGLFAFDFQPGGLMNQLHTGGGFVHFLPALAGRTDKLLRQVGLANIQLVHPFLKLFPFLLRDHQNVSYQTKRVYKIMNGKIIFNVGEEQGDMDGV